MDIRYQVSPSGPRTLQDEVVAIPESFGGSSYNIVGVAPVIAFTDEKLFDEVDALVAVEARRAIEYLLSKGFSADDFRRAERIKASGGAIDTATITEAALNDEDGEMLEAERWSPLYNDLPEDGE